MDLSVSQYNEYRKCPQAWYLKKKLGVWERPAAWLVQGLALHEAVEQHELSGRMLTLEEMQEVYRDAYMTHQQRLTKDTPNLRFWFSSGPYRGIDDLTRRLNKGLEQVRRYHEYVQRHPDETPWETPDGTRAIELGFSIWLGDVRVRGYIDGVYWLPEYGSYLVRDVKSGKTPGDDFQLGVYAVALQTQYGLPVGIGDYWMGESGGPTKPYKLDIWTKETMTEYFGWLEENIEAENFEADPEPQKCFMCSVRTSCASAAS